jgi:hypothetical protein
MPVFVPTYVVTARCLSAVTFCLKVNAIIIIIIIIVYAWNARLRALSIAVLCAGCGKTERTAAVESTCPWISFSSTVYQQAVYTGTVCIGRTPLYPFETT